MDGDPGIDTGEDGEPGAALDFGNDVDMDQLLLAAIQSTMEDGGEINADTLEALGNHLPNDFAELLLQQLQGGGGDAGTEIENQEDIVENIVQDPEKCVTDDPVPSPTGTEPLFLNSTIPEPSPTVPSPSAQSIEIVDLGSDDEGAMATDKAADNDQTNSIQQSLTIIKAEGGITVCHDGSGGDLRPKPVTLTEEPSVPVHNNVDIKPNMSSHATQELPPLFAPDVPSHSNAQNKNLPPVEIKAEVKMETGESHHHHKKKDKHKDKDRDKDRDREGRERHREERELKKRLKEQEKAKAEVYKPPPRHPQFLKLRKKYGLLDTTVTVIKIDTIMPISKHMKLKRRRLEVVEVLDLKRQTQVNNKAGRIRLVPRPRPATAFEYDKTDVGNSSNKRKYSDSKSSTKDDSKRKKIRVLSDDSDSDVSLKKSKQSSGKKANKDSHKPKPHGEFSATGARILPFEKPRTAGQGGHASKEKEPERIIRRPKMEEPKPEVKKEAKRHRVFNPGSEENAKKVQSLLDDAIAQAKQKAAAEKEAQFKIPKANNSAAAPVRESELEIGRYRDRPNPFDKVSTTTPLSLIRQQERRHYDSGRRFVPNSYGQHKQGYQFTGANTQSLGDGSGGFGFGSSGAVESNMTVSEPANRDEAARLQMAKDLEKRILMRAEADVFTDNDNLGGMHDDAGSDDDEVVAEPIVAPLSETEDIPLGPLAKAACDLLSKGVLVKYPTTISTRSLEQPGAPAPKEPSLAETTIQKMAWWLQGIDKLSFRAILSEPINPEADDMAIPSDDGNESVSSFGHVSNPGAEQCQINEISSTNQDYLNNPDVIDEFCGAALIDASFRISADDKFQKVLDCPRGTNYSRNAFTGTCTICKVKLKSKRELGAHVRSEDHRTNFKKISLNIMPNYERTERRRSSETVERVSRIPPLISGRPPATDTTREKVRNGSHSSTSKNSHKEDSSKKSKTTDSSSKPKEDLSKKKDETSKKPTKDSSSSSKPKEDSSKKSNASSTTPSSKEGRDKSMSKKKSEEKSDRATLARAGNGNSDRRSSPTRKRRSRSRSLDRRRRSSPGGSSRRRRRSTSRSRSRSPRRRRMSPAPRRRSTSAEKVAKFLERTRRSRSRSPSRKRRASSRSRSISPKVRIRKSRKHPPIFSEKLKLQAAGKWLPHHEESWKLMEAEEKALDKEISDLRDLLCDRPEDHPQYEGEWQAYWKRTYHEVELAGHNADTYDYVPGWKIQWAKRAEEMMEQLHFDRLGEIRVKHGMDIGALQRLVLDLPAIAIPVRPPPPPPPVQPEVIFRPTEPTPPGELYTPFEDDLMPRAMSLASSTGRSNGPEPLPPGIAPVSEPIVTADMVQKTWATFTGITPVPPKSSGSSADLDLEMELLEVLRLMNSLEDQLSILAPQVEDYFKRAETMEIVSPRKSYDLLEDKDFVALLFQCRDKFMSLIRANILTREVLKRMNKAVFGLTSLLDSEPCQRLRPKTMNKEVTETAVPELEVTATPVSIELEEPPPDFDLLRRSEVSLDPRIGGGASVRVRPFELDNEYFDILHRIRGFMREFSEEQVEAVGSIIAESIVEKSCPMTDAELVDYIKLILDPVLVDFRTPDPLDPYTNPQNSNNPFLNPENIDNPFSISLERKRELPRGMGTALPPYPDIQCRAISPPPRGHMVQHFQTVRGGHGGVRPPLLGMGPRMSHNGPPQQLNLRPDERHGRDSQSPRSRASMSPRTPAMSPQQIRGSMSPADIPSLMSLGDLQPLLSPGGPRPLTSPGGPRTLTSPGGPRPFINPSDFHVPGPSSPYPHRSPSPYSARSSGSHDSRSNPSNFPVKATSRKESSELSDSQPGPSRVIEGENIPPLMSNLNSRNHRAERTVKVKKFNKSVKENKGVAEAFWNDCGSSVSSGSMGEVEENRERSAFELKKGSRSVLSNVSSCASGPRSKLKQKNEEATNVKSLVPKNCDDLAQDKISDVESGEILSSISSEVSVSSSVQNRRRKLQQKVKEMVMVKTLRKSRNHATVSKNLENWFQNRPRDPSGRDSASDDDENRNREEEPRKYGRRVKQRLKKSADRKKKIGDKRSKSRERNRRERSPNRKRKRREKSERREREHKRGDGKYHPEKAENNRKIEKLGRRRKKKAAIAQVVVLEDISDSDEIQRIAPPRQK